MRCTWASCQLCGRCEGPEDVSDDEYEDRLETLKKEYDRRVEALTLPAEPDIDPNDLF
jgi:hypothetical protein